MTANSGLLADAGVHVEEGACIYHYHCAKLDL